MNIEKEKITDFYLNYLVIYSLIYLLFYNMQYNKLEGCTSTTYNQTLIQLPRDRKNTWLCNI